MVSLILAKNVSQCQTLERPPLASPQTVRVCYLSNRIEEILKVSGSLSDS